MPISVPVLLHKLEKFTTMALLKNAGMTPGVDIWDAAAILCNGKVVTDGILKSVPGTPNRHLIVIGQRSAGKTSLIRRYLEKKSDDSAPTTGVCYSFVKSGGDTSRTKIGHIWEIGSTVHVDGMLDLALNRVDAKRVMVFVVIDLSTPQMLFSVLETVLPVLSRSFAKKSLSTDDFTTINSSFLGVPLWLIGAKADLFQSTNMELVNRNAISDALRGCASFCRAGLIFVSKKQQISDARIKQIIDNWFFPSDATDQPTAQTDPLKLILILPGSDQDAKIQAQGHAIGKANELNIFKETLSGHVQQKIAVEFLRAENLVTGYPEPDVDAACALVSAELAKNIKKTTQKSVDYY